MSFLPNAMQFAMLLCWWPTLTTRRNVLDGPKNKYKPRPVAELYLLICFLSRLSCMMGCCCLSWYPLLGAKKFSLVYLNRHNKHQKLAGHGKCRIARNDFPGIFRLFAGSRPTEWSKRREADLQEICNGRGPSNLSMLAVGNDLESVCVTVQHVTPSCIATWLSFLFWRTSSPVFLCFLKW